MDTDELRRKAAAGNTAAQVTLGVSYLEGRDVEADYAEAFRLLTEASRKGASRAIVYLARMYRDGLGIPQDAGRPFGCTRSRHGPASSSLKSSWAARSPVESV